jgi:peroxiredoxin Q/BCP
VSSALPELARRGVRAVGISPDSPARNLRFDEKEGLGFPLLSDPDLATAAAYGVLKNSGIAGVVKRLGVVRSSFLLDENGLVLGAWYGISPEATVPEALAALEG